MCELHDQKRLCKSFLFHCSLYDHCQTAVQARKFDHTPLIILARADTSPMVGAILEGDGLNEEICVTSHIRQVCLSKGFHLEAVASFQKLTQFMAAICIVCIIHNQKNAV